MATSVVSTTPELRPHSQVEKRDLLFEAFGSIVQGIARSVCRRLPASFDADDLAQIGVIRLMNATKEVESYLREVVHGAMVDRVRLDYREAMHLDTANLSSMPASAPSILSRLIDEERDDAVQRSVRSLHPDQVLAINERFQDGPCRVGPPKRVNVVAERKAFNVLRVALARAA